MKKIFTLALALLGFAGVASAATVDDIAPLKHSYVLVCDEITNDGTVKPAVGTLVGDDHFLLAGSDKNKSVATNKGSVDLSVADGEIVTEAIAAKYGEYGKHLNSLRLKNQQDMFVMKVTAGSKIIIFFNGQGKTGASARIPKLSTDEKQTATLNAAPTAESGTVGTARLEYTAPDDMTIYVGSYNGDLYISYVIVEAKEAPGTPTVKVGNQTYEDGLWFREVTCKANPMIEEGSTDAIPTVVTYTTDGSTPTAASPKYTEPIKCYKDMTVKFQAFMDLFGTGEITDEDICPGADNEGNVNFQFNAPAINVDGAHVTIVSEYEDVQNYISLNGAEAEALNEIELSESATVSAYSVIENGDYCTFTTKSTAKDVYVLNPIKSEKIITVKSGDVVVDEEATATNTQGETVYKVVNGAIDYDKKDFFVKNPEFGIVKTETDAAYQIDGKEVYIKMNSTNISFKVDGYDSLTVVVTCSKNSCKTFNAANDETVTTDRKCFVNVSGKTYGTEDITATNEDGTPGNVITFGLKGEEGGSIFTFQKYSGTGNILISSIKFIPYFDDPTGISDVKAAAAQNGAVYNLAGQKVNAAFKGLVIKNGKKVVMK